MMTVFVRKSWHTNGEQLNDDCVCEKALIHEWTAHKSKGIDGLYIIYQNLSSLQLVPIATEETHDFQLTYDEQIQKHLNTFSLTINFGKNIVKYILII